MATLRFTLSKRTRVEDGVETAEVKARLHSSSTDLYAKTGVRTPVSFTDRNGNTRQCWKDGRPSFPRLVSPRPEDLKVKSMVEQAGEELERRSKEILARYDKRLARGEMLGSTWLQDEFDGKADKPKAKTLYEDYVAFLSNPNNGMERRTKQLHRRIAQDLLCYSESVGRTMTLDDASVDDLTGFERWCREEGLSENTISTRMKRLRTFFRWANGLSSEFPIEPLTHNNPFDRYKVKAEKYGTPFFLTLEERNLLADAPLSGEIAVQRDIFVFQCLIGCRVSDLMRLTPDNIVDGFVEYVPRKTMDDRPVRVRVPLNERAKAILSKYAGRHDEPLLPFHTPESYNKYIKRMLKEVGIERMVTLIDPVTRKEVRKPICEVASSHMARRTFVGNLYKKVKDPNLVGKLSGHAENSVAFARYRDIDDDMAKELVGMIE